MAGKSEPTLAEIMQRQLSIEAKLEQLIEAAKQGGGLVPQVDFVKLRKLRRQAIKHGAYVKCKKECRKGPCRYGAAQALRCYEQFEKMKIMRKRRKLFAAQIPYQKKQLDKLPRRDLLTIAGIVGVNIRRMFLKSKGRGNEPLIKEILKRQIRWVKIRDKMNAKERRRQEREELQRVLQTPEAPSEGTANA